MSDGPGVCPSRCPRVAALHLEADTPSRWGASPCARLVFVDHGFLRLELADALWCVPPQCAVWVLPNARYRLWDGGALSAWTLTLPERSSLQPVESGTVPGTPLLRELLDTAAGFGAEPWPGSPGDHLLQVLLELLPLAPLRALHLPLPATGPLAQLAETSLRDPLDDQILAGWMRHHAVLESDALPAFQVATGVTFDAWRRRLRLFDAIACDAAEIGAAWHALRDGRASAWASIRRSG